VSASADVTDEDWTVEGFADREPDRPAIEAAVAAVARDLGIEPPHIRAEAEAAVDWLGRNREALREFQAAVAMDPLDKAAAHYRLARAYTTLRDSERARRHILMSLEAAPSYRPAQKLLLELTGK